MANLDQSGSVTLVLGGVRSGKSRFGQTLAATLGGDEVLVVATAEVGDDEMRRRIERHRRDRPSTWQTLERPENVGSHLSESQPPQSVWLVDCLTLLVSNILCNPEAFRPDCTDPDLAERLVLKEVDDLLLAARTANVHLVIVSGEVGCGIVPEYAFSRLFRDLLGFANQTVNAQADAAYLMVAGLAVNVKTLATSVTEAAASLRRPIEAPWSEEILR